MSIKLVDMLEQRHMQGASHFSHLGLPPVVPMMHPGLYHGMSMGHPGLIGHGRLTWSMLELTVSWTCVT